MKSNQLTIKFNGTISILILHPTFAVMRKVIALTFFIACLHTVVCGQSRSNLGDTIVNAKLIQFSYAIQFPFADMADRFGNNSSLGASFSFKMAHNWMIGFEGNFLFGGNIKEDTILDHLFTSQGFLIGTNGYAESVLLFERGMTFWGKFGKLFPVMKGNPNAGINVLLGAGFLQHKIKIEDPDNAVPYVTGDYSKGYDRLTNGFALTQYVGFLNLDKRKFLNFNAGIELIEGFTKNRRDYNFDQMKKDDASRIDILVGLKIAYILPFYGRGEQRFYTN